MLQNHRFRVHLSCIRYESADIYSYSTNFAALIIIGMRKLSMDELHRKTVEEFSNSKKFPIIVVIEKVRSAYNVGSIFRTSDAFLLQEILIVGYTATPLNNKVAKTALGAGDSMQWQHFNTSDEAIKYLKEKGYCILGVEQTDNSTSLQNLKNFTDRPTAFIFGNEVTGVEKTTLDQCDGVIEIPQFGTKHSLNVSVAAGMVLWEAVKQYPMFQTTD